MWFFTSGAFWFAEGIVFVLAITGLKVWMEDRNTPFGLWKCLLASLWMLMLGFTIAFIGTSVGENEIVAAKKGGIIFSVICFITGVVVWRLLRIGRVKIAPGDEDEEV
ncbi:MAG: hypothetical protein ISS69_17115 [Phycisphaerae bacterium]|nr:hypothetical protein [Planctomycetota bacterium]MBL7221833.1 hypothetical protein [Phycisphaerae bacterium]